jgi:hypothetical protein
MKGDPDVPPQRVPLEEAVPLSESILWRIHSEYFETRGIAAWSSGDVPHRVTTSPVLARSYVRLVEGLVEDCAAGRFGAVDESEPIYVVELGAGSGRFGFNFLAALDETRVAPFRIVYVLTDRVESNIDFWSKADVFAEHLRAGRVDFAYFDAGEDSSLRLRHGGVDLVPGELANPLVCLANYLFDVQPQDLFSIVDGSLNEELVQVYGPEGFDGPATKSYVLDLRCALRSEQVGDSRYPGISGELLRATAERQAEGARFLFPSRALATLEALSELSARRLLLLIGERPLAAPASVGATSASSSTLETEDGAIDLHAPGWLIRLGVHGASVSLPIDTRILAEAAAIGGGKLLSPEEPPRGLLVEALVLGAVETTANLDRAFRTSIGDLAPDAVVQAIRVAQRDGGNAETLSEFLAVMQLAQYDPKLLADCRPGLVKLLSTANRSIGKELVQCLRRVYRLDYPMGDAFDLAVDIAFLVLRVDCFEDALWFFEESTRRSGPTLANRIGAGLCHALNQDLAGALTALREALELNPSEDDSNRLRELRIQDMPIEAALKDIAERATRVASEHPSQ